LEGRPVEYDEVANKPSYRTIIEYHPEVDILFRCRSRMAEPVEINGVNPVLHVMLEMNALGAVNDPEFPCAREAMERLKSEGFSEHACLCAIGRLISLEIYGAYTEAHADNERLRRRLGLLSSHPVKSPGRNEPCPCGSGLKFKKCCLSVVDAFTVTPRDGELNLGVGSYVLTRDFTSPENLLLYRMENRVHIADYLEREGMIDEALASLRDNYAEAQSLKDELIENALTDLMQLCLNQRSLSSAGIEYCRKLLDMPTRDEESAWNRNTARCDLADLTGRAKGFAEGLAEFDKLIAGDPAEGFFRYRKALYLLDNDRREDAEALLAEVAGGLGAEHDDEVAVWARDVLEDEFGLDRGGGKRRPR